MELKRIYLLQVAIFMLGTSTSMASLPEEANGTAPIPVKCKGWFEPETEAKNIAAFEAMKKAQGEQSTENTDAGNERAEGSIHWTPEMKKKLDEAVEIFTQISRDLHNERLTSFYARMESGTNGDLDAQTETPTEKPVIWTPEMLEKAQQIVDGTYELDKIHVLILRKGQRPIELTVVEENCPPADVGGDEN